MTTLHFTHCKKCGKDYLVGIDGKDITKSETSGGENHMAIGNDELEKAQKLPIYTDCKNCGETCKIDEATSQKKQMGIKTEEIKEEIRLLKQYNQRKLKDLQNTLDMLIRFSREDLKRIDKIESKLGIAENISKLKQKK